MSGSPHQDQKIEGSSIESSQVQLGQAKGDLTQVQGSNNWVLNFVINLFGTQQSSPRQDYRHRKALIDKVRRSWIEGVLERSLFDRAQIELGLERRFDALALDYETPEQLRQPLPKGTKISERFFEQLEVGRTLLILGEPGAGKTTILLELTRDLLLRGECDVSLPVPVVFNLSSWIDPKQSVADWLVQELNNKYQVSKSLSRIWIKEQQLFLLLDGLDEVKVENREDCVKAINQFTQKYGQTEIVVCSRVTDYEAISQRFRFQAAIFIQPLTTEQVKDYLTQAGEKLFGMKTALQTDVVLQELTHTPLMLSVMTLAYEGFSVEELPKMSLEERRKHPCNTYVERMFQRRRMTALYAKEQARHWLTWLAQRMILTSQTVFLIEQMQPTWLHSKDKKNYAVGNILIGGLIGILFGLLLLASVGFNANVFEESFLALVLQVFLISSTSKLTFYTLFFGFLGVFFCTISLQEIKTVEILTWSWQTARQRTRGYLSFLFQNQKLFISFALISWLIRWILKVFIDKPAFFGTLINDLLVSLLLFPIIIPFVYFIIGLFTLLFGGLHFSIRETKVIPNQGIWNSAQNSIICGSVFGLIPGLFLALVEPLVGLGIGLGIGLIGWLMYGGGTCIQHFILRLILYRKGFTPWNYARFLSHAADRLFLQKVGGGYIFIHRLLMEHFAQMEQDSQSS